MKINIRPENCKFHVNREKRKVVCIYEGTSQMLMNFLDNEPIGDMIFMYDTCATLPNRFIGIATCSEEDTWDEEFGKRLAFQRMKKTFYHTFFAYATKFFDVLDNKINETVEHLNNYGARISQNIDREHERINDYLDRA